MPRSLRYDEPYLLDERAASPIRHSGIRWGIGLVRFRRILPIAVRPGECPLTERTAGVQPVRQERVFMPRMGHSVIHPPPPLAGPIRAARALSGGP